MPFLLTALLGLWEVGRMVQVQNLAANAAREGGRQAAAGINNNATICQNVVNDLVMNGLSNISYTSVSGSTTSGSNVVSVPSTTGLSPGQTITGTGIPTGTTIVSVNNGSNQITLSQNATATGSGVSMIGSNISVTLTNATNASRSNPQTANQLDQFNMTVTIPYSVIRWSVVAQITPTTAISVTATWYSMMDTPCSINTTIPSN